VIGVVDAVDAVDVMRQLRAWNKPSLARHLLFGHANCGAG
jgi:hypothetical protein